MSTLTEQREREIAAKNQVDAARDALDRAHRQLGVAQAELRTVQSERRRTTAEAHEKAAALRGAALEQAKQQLSEYLPRLRTNEPVPEMPPPDVVAAFIAAGAPQFWDALHAAIDAEPANPRTAIFSARTPEEIDADIAERERRIEELRQAVKDRQTEVAEARGDHTAATEGR
jgi:hypothetical protein